MKSSPRLPKTALSKVAAAKPPRIPVSPTKKAEIADVANETLKSMQAHNGYIPI